jgi:hypothetical protein
MSRDKEKDARELELRKKWFVNLIKQIKDEEEARKGRSVTNIELGKLLNNRSGQTIAQWLDTNTSPDPSAIDLGTVEVIARIARMDTNMFLDEMKASYREETAIKKSDAILSDLRNVRSRLGYLSPDELAEQVRLFVNHALDIMQGSPMARFRRSLRESTREIILAQGTLKISDISNDRINEILKSDRPSVAETETLFLELRKLGFPLKDEDGKEFTGNQLIRLTGHEPPKEQKNSPRSIREAKKQFSKLN